ncbi:unnamed protein product [Arctogadus glacialis]
MDQSLLGNVLGHLAQMAERQGQLHQEQNEVLTELAQLARAMLRELLASGGCGEGPRGEGAPTHGRKGGCGSRNPAAGKDNPGSEGEMGRPDGRSDGRGGLLAVRAALPLPAGEPYDGGGAGRPRHHPGEVYRIPVRIQRGTHQVLLDSGCMQPMIHQRLVRS